VESLNLEAVNLACGYGKRIVIGGLSFALGRGEILCVLGPNGSGKTTLFRTLLGFQPPLGGRILLDNEDLKTWSRKKLAMKIAYVPQAHTPPFPYTVEDVILMGRTVRFANPRHPSKEDFRRAGEVMELLHIGELKDRPYTRISGGERQLVLIARALAQEPEFLVMDEPASSLDFGNQMKLLDHNTALKDTGAGILMTSHHPDHVFRCASRVLLIQRDGTAVIGPVEPVLTEENLKAAYGIDVRILRAETADGRIIRTCAAMYG
jgi:iron complex transport system ATP-binding protein